jgi:UDP-N-acetylglucosamine--N-acetylmuramyl-(pentapeptide) pyrophosphoryl-undecaprenol N-acetylglucosamine transferase
MKRVTIMAGGTGGHIFPGLAVAAALKKRGVAVDWLGARGGMEMELVAANDIAITPVDIQGLRGKGLGRLLRLPGQLLRAVWQARRALKQPGSQPADHAVLSMGGYVAAPGGLAARLLHRPLVVHEQNSVLGLTNRTLARWAKQILTGFELPELAKARWVGNPVREAIVEVGRQRADRAYHSLPVATADDNSSAIKVLVLGGSQGAQALNTRLPAQLAEYLKKGVIRVRHQSGKNKEASARDAYARAGVTEQASLSIEPFIADMAAAYAWADLVIARAGALSMAEIQAAALPALYVPFPQAVDDHQSKNAEYAVTHGAALMWQESEDDNALAARLGTLLESAERRREMAEKSHVLAKPDAADAVATACLEVMRS